MPLRWLRRQGPTKGWKNGASRLAPTVVLASAAAITSRALIVTPPSSSSVPMSSLRTLTEPVGKNSRCCDRARRSDRESIVRARARGCRRSWRAGDPRATTAWCTALRVGEARRAIVDAGKRVNRERARHRLQCPHTCRRSRRFSQSRGSRPVWSTNPEGCMLERQKCTLERPASRPRNKRRTSRNPSYRPVSTSAVDVELERLDVGNSDSPLGNSSSRGGKRMFSPGRGVARHPSPARARNAGISISHELEVAGPVILVDPQQDLVAVEERRASPSFHHPAPKLVPGGIQGTAWLRTSATNGPWNYHRDWGPC